MIDIATPLSFGGFSRATLDAFAPQLRAARPRAAPVRHRRRQNRARHGQSRRPQARLHDQRAAHLRRFQRRRRRHRHPHRRQSRLRLRPPLSRCRLHRPALRALRSRSRSCPTSTPRSNSAPPANGWAPSTRTATPPSPANSASARRWCPCRISVSRAASPSRRYQMQMVNDPLLSPLLLQMAVFSAIDATERTVGAATHPRHAARSNSRTRPRRSAQQHVRRR